MGNLKEIEKELAGFRFKKINRNQLINLRHFRSYTLNDRTIIMASDVVPKASRCRLIELIEISDLPLNSYLIPLMLKIEPNCFLWEQNA